MLARNAESLYWIGRYVERADDTARILDVSVHQLLEDATVNPDVASRQLLTVLASSVAVQLTSVVPIALALAALVIVVGVRMAEPSSARGTAVACAGTVSTEGAK